MTKRIADNPSFKKLNSGLSNAKIIKDNLPIIGDLIGIDTEILSDSLKDIEKLKEDFDLLSVLPDEFNGYFSRRGFVVYEFMHLPTIKLAVEKAKAGDIDGAELDLVNHYSEEQVRFYLSRMKNISAFRPRLHLADLALKDYTEGRYHASIPVVLAIIDGLVSELNLMNGQKRGLSAKETVLSAWGSIAAHSSGLGVLIEIYTKGRYTTRTEEIRAFDIIVS